MLLERLKRPHLCKSVLYDSHGSPLALCGRYHNHIGNHFEFTDVMLFEWSEVQAIDSRMNALQVKVKQYATTRYPTTSTTPEATRLVA